MKRLLLAFTALVFVLGAGSPLVIAGGWASVRSNETLTTLVAGETQAVELSVWAHDRTKTEVESMSVVATNAETGESLTFPAEATGETGEYVAEITIPEVGTWKFVALIPPYPEFALPTVEIGSVVSAMDRNLRFGIGSGDCGSVESVTETFELARSTANAGLFGGTISGLTNGSLLLILGSDDLVQACGILPDGASGHLTVVTLEPVDGGSPAAIVSLPGVGETRSVQVLPIELDAGANVTTIEIVTDESSQWSFSPAEVEIASGDVVVWINDSGVVHTIASDSPGVADSALIEPLGMHTQMFTEAGTYEYLCGPHPMMTGRVVVAD